MIAISTPPKLLSANIVRSYYHLVFNQHQQKNSGVVIDDSCYELMFVKERNVQVKTGKGEIFALPPYYTLNNLEGPFKFKFPDTFTTFCVKLEPWMNRSFFFPATSEVLDLSTIYGDSVKQLYHDLFASTSLDEMVSYAEQFLIALAIAPNKEVPLIKSVCELIYEKCGDITVSEIAEHFGVYRQKLNKLFKQEVKYTLKTFINNIRIRACLDYKLKHPETALTTIAYQFGFCDQAHFIHSFKKACGVSPSEYLKSPGYSFSPERVSSSVFA